MLQPDTTNKSRIKHARLWRYGIRICVGCAFLALTIGISVRAWLTRVDAQAAQISDTGSELNQLLKVYSQHLSKRQISDVLKLYDDSRRNAAGSKWTEEATGNRDGIFVYSWQRDTNAQPVNLEEQLNAVVDRFDEIEWAKFMLSEFVQIPSKQEAIVLAILHLRGMSTNGGMLERQLTYKVTFCRMVAPWRIIRQELLGGWSVEGTENDGFADVTATAGIDFRAHHNSMLDEPAWTPAMYETVRYAGNGVAAVDYDNDGWCDIFFADGQRPALYRNTGNGTFRDVTQLAGLPTFLPGVNVALFADLDNDGYRDLFLGRQTGASRLFRNKGDGTFADISPQVNFGGPWVTAATATDYDNDGRLDLYIGRYLDPRNQLPTTLFYTRNGAGNTLLRNEGDFRFSDVTEQAGLREGGITFAMAWADIDHDHDQDVYVVNDFGRNALFRNNADGTFSDVASESGAIDIGYGMSASFADIDNDGDFDMYISNVHSGQRWFGHAITFQKYCLTSIQQGAIWEDFKLLHEVYDLLDGNLTSLGMDVVRGNTLLLNRGDGTFEDISQQSGTNPVGWYWGSAIFDFDNDGRQDIYAVNGWISGLKPDDL